MVGIAYQTCVEASLNSICLIFTVAWDKLFEVLMADVLPQIKLLLTGTIKSIGGGKQ